MISIEAYTLTTALGSGIGKHHQELIAHSSGLKSCDFMGAESLETYIGRVEGVEDVSMPKNSEIWDCRSHRIALLGLEADGFMDAVKQQIGKYGSDRVGVIVGTSTAGILETELAYRELYSGSEKKLPGWYRYQNTHNLHSIARFVSDLIGSEGYTLTISTACSSSAKVFASASRAINADICDAVVVGGVDTLCLTTLFGFDSLQLISQTKCAPFDENRNGISIGEGAGFALLTKGTDEDHLGLFGYGESSDAFHMSSPHPDGLGAQISMKNALNNAKLESWQIEYVNLHGTGTKANDSTEAKAITEVLGEEVKCSSTKGFTGHTLGACGIIESNISLIALEKQFLPASLNLKKQDQSIDLNILLDTEEKRYQYAMTNSFGFGGNNCSLIFGLID